MQTLTIPCERCNQNPVPLTKPYNPEHNYWCEGCEKIIRAAWQEYWDTSYRVKR